MLADCVRDQSDVSPVRRATLVALVVGGGGLNLLLALFPAGHLLWTVAVSAAAALAAFLAASLTGDRAGRPTPRAALWSWSGWHLRWWIGALVVYGVLFGRIWSDVRLGSTDLVIWAVGITLVAVPIVRGVGPLARFRPTTLRRDVPIVLGLMALVVALHVHDLRDWRYAVVGDEMLFFERALDIVRGGVRDPFVLQGVYYNSPMLNSVYQALFVWLAPDDGWGWKFSSVVSVALTVPPMYMLGRRFGGAGVGAAAAVLAAAGHYVLAFTHIGYTHLDALPVMAWGMLAFTSAVRMRSDFLMLVSGLVMGLSLYTALPARALVVVAAVWVATSVRSWDDVRSYWPLVLGLMACSAPFVAENGIETMRVMGRDTMSPYSVYVSEIGDPLSRLLGNFDNLLVWWHHPDRISHYTSGSLLDRATGVLAVVGLGAALYRWRPRHRLVLLWLAVAILPTALLAPYPQAPLTRMHGAVLPISLVAAMGLGSVLRGFRVSGYFRWAVVISALAVVVILNQWRFQHTTFNAMDIHMVESLSVGAWESELCGTGPDTLFVGRDGHLMEKVLASYASVRPVPAVVSYDDARVFDDGPGCRIFFRPDDAAAQEVFRRLDEGVEVFENPSGGSWVAVIPPGSTIESGGGDDIY